ncbi:RTA1 like protein-domain-containing protein [Mycena rebaudengoi]|nr:RTA1 like protein-domain-containing protein [Mycena rebaudengoi]
MISVKCTAADVAKPDFSYLYCPSFPAAITFATLFGLTTILHLIQAIHYRKKFCWVLIMAGAWETGGLALRVLSVLHPTSEVFGVTAQLLILLAPIWINAFDYVVMSRVVHLFSPDKRVLGIGARRLALCFVLLDITAFLMQVGGGVIIDNDDPKIALTGIHIYMGGIGLQECFVLLFVGIVFRFQRHDSAELPPGAWKRVVYPLYASLVLITLRIIFRLVEFSSGVRSPITQTEVPFYALEALPMFIALALWNVWHPGKVLIGPDSEFPKRSRAQKRAEKAQKKEAKAQRKSDKKMDRMLSRR